MRIHDLLLIDATEKEMRLKPGESSLLSIPDLESLTYKGILTLTNFRALWTADDGRITASIGWNKVVNVELKELASRLRGASRSIIITAKDVSRISGYSVDASEEEDDEEGRADKPVHVSSFVFTAPKGSPMSLLMPVRRCWEQFEAVDIYREGKLRWHVAENGGLIPLPDEKVYSDFQAANVGEDQGTLGRLVLTNIRIVWYSLLDDTISVSIPHVVIKDLTRNDSKYGPVMVVKAESICTGDVVKEMTFGFKIDPVEGLHACQQECLMIWKLFKEKPVTGMDLDQEKRESTSRNFKKQGSQAEDEEILKDTIKVRSRIALAKPTEGEEYCPELGLMIKKLPPGVTYKSVWEVI